MKNSLVWLVGFAAVSICVLLTLSEVRDFHRAAEPFEVLTGRRVQAAGGDVGEMLGRRAIERLDLSGRGMNDEALLVLQPSLERLPWLEQLSLARARVSGRGLAAFKNLSQLRELDLQQTPVGDEALVHLQSLSQLESLDLTATRVTDRGIAELAGLTNLRILWLGGTRITDASIEELRRHEQLEIVSVADTAVTEVGVRRLEKALPYCTVIRRARAL